MDMDEKNTPSDVQHHYWGVAGIQTRVVAVTLSEDHGETGSFRRRAITDLFLFFFALVAFFIFWVIGQENVGVEGTHYVVAGTISRAQHLQVQPFRRTHRVSWSREEHMYVSLFKSRRMIPHFVFDAELVRPGSGTAIANIPVAR
jgi:hypothetical protein